MTTEHRFPDILLWLLVVLISAEACALAQPADTLTNRPAPLPGYEIPALETFIAAAIDHSPMLAGQNQAVALALVKKQLAGRQWLDFIRLGSDIRYGTNDYVYLDRESLQYNVYTKPYETTRYNAGISVDLSLFDLTARRQLNQLAQIDIEITRARKEELLLALKNAVISQYYQLILSQKSLEILALQKASSELQTQMAEIQFNQQLMDFIEYSKILEFHTKTLLDFEKAASEFQKNKFLMQELAGFTF